MIPELFDCFYLIARIIGATSLQCLLHKGPT